MKRTIKTKSPEETFRFGQAFGSLLKDPHTVLLLGGMGAGKTAITKGIVAGMKIEDDVSSPTYTLVNVYEDGNKKVYHFDLYRLGDAEALYEMGFEDYLEEGCTSIIEWPQLAESYPFSSKITLELSQNDQPEQRIITVCTENEALLSNLKQMGW